MTTALVLTLGFVCTDPSAARSGDRVVVAKDVPVTANLAASPRANNSPALAVDPSDSRFVALASRMDAHEFGCALHVSGDGGRSWIPSNPVPALPAEAETCYAPEIAFDSSGTLFYLFVGLKGEGNEPMGVFLTTSSDRGRTFSQPRQILGPFKYMVRLAIANTEEGDDALHLVWLDANSDPGLGSLPAPPNPILSSRSLDGGLTWSKPVGVSERRRQRVIAPTLALGPEGAVHVAYYDLLDDARDYHGLEGPTWEGKWALVLSSSFDGGRRFVRHSEVDDSVAPTERVMLIFTMPAPSLVVDASHGILAAWSDARHGDPDVLLRRSTDKGASWSAAIRLNDDPRGNGRNQYLPRLSIGPANRIDSVFYDRRRSPTNSANDLLYTFSRDGGARFAPNTRLSSKPSDAGIGPRYKGPAAAGLVEFGSRLALFSRQNSALAAWTDTRNAQGPPQQDIFATEVDLGVEGQPLRPAPAIGLAAVVAALATALFIARRLTSRRHSSRILQVIALLLFAAVACRTPTYLPPRPPHVDIEAEEYRFRHRTTAVPRGRVVFRIRNSGVEPHQLVLAPLPKGAKSLESVINAPARQATIPLSILSKIEPGDDATFAQDLSPGRYALMCLLQDASKTTHFMRGMRSELDVA